MEWRCGWQTACMNSLMRWAAAALLSVLAAVATALVAAVQPEPAVALTAEVSQNDVASALALLRAHDPRRAVPGVVQRVLLNERDLELLLNHAAARRLLASTQMSIGHGAATVRSSLHLPANPFGRWLNVQVRLTETAGLPEITSLQVGRLPVPVWLGAAVARHLAARAGLDDELRLAAEVVQRVSFTPQQMGLRYAWQGDSTNRALQALTPQAELQRLQAYQAKLVALAERGDAQPSLVYWTQALFALARQRSAAAGGDAAGENRAALMGLTLYANGQPLHRLGPAALGWPVPRPLRLTLAGREDTPLHLLISASLAAEASSPLSRAVGLYKEVADSRGGSGFSFNDLAADRAGTRLGELAALEPRRLQAALALAARESDFMPAAADLPEAMAEPEFKRRFGGVGAPAYLAMVAEIDRRVAGLAALR